MIQDVKVPIPTMSVSPCTFTGTSSAKRFPDSSLCFILLEWGCDPVLTCSGNPTVAIPDHDLIEM
jgi:hypothetical protein